MSVSPNDRTEIISAIKKRVLSNHFNFAGVDYGAWAQRINERTATLIQSETAAFEAGVRELIAELGSSHTVFYHERSNRLLPQHAIGGTLQSFDVAGGQRWSFLDVFEEGPADKAGIKAGDALLALDEIACEPPEMPPFQLGRKFKLSVARGADVRVVEIEIPFRKGTKERPPIIEPKSPIHRMVAPAIGLLKVPYFPDPTGLRFAESLDAAVQDLKGQGCTKLVIDLRGNIGGSLGFARLASYLCPHKIPIGHSLTPRRVKEGYDREALPRVPMPATRMQLFLTLARYALKDKSVVLLTQGLGAQPFHGNIAILINEWTNSAGEILAGFACENGLATLIGTRTAGNVLGAVNFSVGHGYWLRLPVFGWYTSQGRCLEGVGVEPNIRIDADPTMLAQSEDLQLKMAVQRLEGTSNVFAR